MSIGRKKVLLLHGNRQTGEVLLGRIEKLKKALSNLGLDIVAQMHHICLRLGII